MFESPFQNAVDDEVRIATDGRSEMRIFVEAECEMAQRVSGVARLLQGTQHEVREDAFFGLADHLSNEPLIMLRSDAQIAAGKGNAHWALAAFAVGIWAASPSGSRYPPVAHGDFALMQVLDSKRVAESARQLFEFENFAAVRLFVHTMERLDAAFQEVTGHSTVRSQHELFNQAVRDVALTARDVGHALLLVEFNDAFGQIEINGSVLVAPCIEEKCQLFHAAEMIRERGISLAHFGVAFQDFVDVGVGHALRRADDAGSHTRGLLAASSVEVHQYAHDQAIF